MVLMMGLMMIIGGVMLNMMTTMALPEIMTVTMMMTVVVLVPGLNIQVCVSKFNLFACLITAFPKKGIMELIINLL